MDRPRELVQDVRAILGSLGRSSKFFSYFQLLEVFKEAGCPVCIRQERGALKVLDALMYEQVNDPVTRARLVESHGFCNWHAWMLPRIGSSGLGVALIYRHLLHKTLDRLEAARRAMRPRSRWRRLRERLSGRREEPLPILAGWSLKARCPICVSVHRSEDQDLKTILEFIGEAEFGGAFSASSGLCLPHLYAVMDLGRDHPNMPALLTSHEKRWQVLLQELAEYARKFDYRHTDEAMGRERDSWLRVLEVFVGRAGVFGPERSDVQWAVPPGPMPMADGSSGRASTQGGEHSVIK